MDKEQKEDEEISIDLSKITGFFKKKKKESTSTENAPVNTSPQEEKKEHINQPKESSNKEESHSSEKIETQSNSPENKPNQEKIKSNLTPEPKTEEKPVEQKIASEETKKTEDDEEISIDFSKIKNMFKTSNEDKKEKTSSNIQTQSTGEGKKSDEEEINIDFSKLKNIKNIFKSSEKEEKTENNDDINLDFGKVKDFIIRHKAWFLIIIPLFLSIFFRIQPAYLPVTDDWATSSVSEGIKAQIREQINGQYPNLPEQNRETLVDQQFAGVLNDQRQQIDAQVAATSQSFKSRLQDDSGQTYLLAIDPHFWLRHAKNIVENGHPGDELKNGLPWDNHMLAPNGRAVPFDMFHAYFIVFIFKIMSVFAAAPNLMKASFYAPVILSALAVIPAFFITRKITGNFGGFIAGLIVAVHPSFLTRTAGGFSDTDAYNVVFPLFIAWMFLESLDAKDFKWSAIYGAIGGLLIGFYGFAWIGWWYIFDFILASAGLYIVFYAIVHRKELSGGINKFLQQKAIKNSLTFMVTFILVSCVSLSIFVSFGHFIGFLEGPLGFIKLKEVGIDTIWPNVYTTVAEQNTASLNNVVNQVGLGKFYFFLLAAMGMALTLPMVGKRNLYFVGATLGWYLLIFILKVQDLNLFLLLMIIPIAIRLAIALWESDTKIDIKYAIFLALWFVATVYASTKGVRFTLLVVPAFAVGFAVALSLFAKYISGILTKSFNINKIIAKGAIMLLILIFIGIVPVPWEPFCIGATCSSAYNTAKSEIPSFTDAWRDALEAIKEDSKEDAIINSWWDFGHWFKMWGDRAVTFDGTTQNTAQAHWIGKVLLTDNEQEAIGILRMLDCGERDGFTMINKEIKDGGKTIQLLNEIILLDRYDAKKILSERISEESVESILNKTHCEPPENYFITSEDMVGKSGVWAHFGSWDFDRALIYSTLKKKEYEQDSEKSTKFLMDRFDYSQNEADSLFFEVQDITDSGQANSWIAPWPGYAGAVGCGVPNEDNVLTCSNGFIVNLTTKDAYANAAQGTLHPKKISFPEENGIFVREYNESIFVIQNGRELGLTLIKNGESYSMIQMDSDLTASMFTRMFYQNGLGLKHFNHFTREQSMFGSTIIVWKVDWDGVADEPAVEVEEVKETDKEELNEPTPSKTEENNTEPIEEESLNNSNSIESSNNTE